MASISSFLKLSLILLLTWAMASMVVAQPLLSAKTLADRLQSNSNNNAECWESLLELKACTGEVILFFLNGEVYLGPSCCRAIGIIEHKCWPAMLTSLGFTVEEGDILRGYCDATDNSASSPHPPPPPQLPSASSITINEGA